MQERQSWGNKVDFVLSTIGYAVGLGNIWRFPYLCYKSGGGAFLIPYFIMLFFVGVPLFVMEVAVGQYTGQGPIGAMKKICPLFMGAGLGMCVMAGFFCIYYNVVISWALYYLYATFANISKGTLPWTSCGHSWNHQDTCWDNRTAVAPNTSQQASEQYYNDHVLEKSAGIDHPDGFPVHMLVCLVISWVLVYFALFRGIRWTGKLVYFTAVFPYVILFTLLGWGATLPGAKEGVLFFIRPVWSRLTDYSVKLFPFNSLYGGLFVSFSVWVDAAIQNFNSIGICFGSIIAFSSYNKFNNNCVMDCLIVAAVNSLTSLLSGFVIFSVLGYIATTSGAKLEDVVEQGPGLVFILYPAAFSELPAAHFWAAAFFFMLVLLGIDSQFAGLEVILTTIEDHGGKCLARIRREFMVLIVCIICFCLGLPMVTKGGIYVFELVNYYSSGISLMYLAFFECIAVCWFYGAHTLSKNIKEMTGRRPFIFFIACWWVIAPVLIFVMWVFGWKGYAKPKVGTYEYPEWAEAIGWVIACLSIVPIPIFAAWVIITAPGNFIENKADTGMEMMSQMETNTKRSWSPNSYDPPPHYSTLTPSAPAAGSHGRAWYDEYKQPQIYSTPSSSEPVIPTQYRRNATNV